MKITRLQTIDFQGLHGKREYSFPNKITALAMPNGSGKTSLLNAIRFALTGNAGEGITISGKAAKTDVAITTESGAYIIREIPREGDPKFWYNKKVITRTALEKAISSLTGCESGVLKTVTASELIGSMKPQELGDLMLGYIPETLDTGTVTGYIPDCTDGMKEIAEEILPTGTFGTAGLDAGYKAAYKRRTAAKKEKAEMEATLRILSKTPMPKEGEEALKKQLEAIKKQQEEMTVYRTKKAEYDRQTGLRKQQEEKLKLLRDQLSKLPEAVYDEKKTAALKKDMEELQKEADDTKRTAAALSASAEALKKALQELDSPVCPLSKKLTCTTDKTAVRGELSEAAEKAEKELEVQKKRMDDIRATLEKESALLRELEEARINAVKRDALQKQADELEIGLKNIQTEEPKKPAETVSGVTEAEIQEKLNAIKAYDRAATVRSDLAAKTRQVEDLEKLVSALEPKGFVRNSVTRSYISAFEASVNARAAQLKPGMKMKFVQRDGIVPMLDVNGDGLYYPYGSLSGGEKIFMVFLLLDMLNAMCGLKILFLDELSVLDEDNFKALISVLNSVTDYDQVFITTVDHESLVKALKAVKDIDVIDKL